MQRISKVIIILSRRIGRAIRSSSLGLAPIHTGSLNLRIRIGSTHKKRAYYIKVPSFSSLIKSSSPITIDNVYIQS